MNSNEMLNFEWLTKKYNENTKPLYVSYPTTSWWRDTFNIDMYKDSFENTNLGSIYIHFPYCSNSCYYCCCYREVTNDESSYDVYLSYLEKEITFKTGLLGIEKFNSVISSHWGGGTPTYMTLKQINKAFNILCSHIRNYESISNKSIEAYPDEKVLTKEKLNYLKDLGFNIISFGIQDFDEKIQKTINRNVKREAVERIINYAKEIGFNVHIDLCYGLPFQGLNEFEKTLGIITKLKPDRIATYPYSHFPMVFPLQRLIPNSSLPNAFITSIIAKMASEFLVDVGYYKVGYDHYVRENNELNVASYEKKVIRDFMGQSSIDKKYSIGFGTAAISYFNDVLYHNTDSVKQYYKEIDENKIPIKQNMCHILTKDDEIRNRLILKSILSDFYIDKLEYEKMFSIDFDKYFEKELGKIAECKKDGLIYDIDTKKMKLTDYGKLFSRSIAHIFDNYYK